ncbi:MAG TPA: MotA/TolQ/ExbB proton channel family protein [Kiritimatiellia bacterium]|nr:MotA/TolQ/ExbB proton channel family protein [Kiritimatiellia bacterium]HMO98382.1 MotA/TolQ/ExbB proton channel family protein [Kiritimatiellia bacterium]HMP96760.1 MotA/TolQ/ExbB proton channel family protein [Kiritimatiellia bacterium]
MIEELSIWVYWRSGGVLLIPLALTSVGIWALFLHMRRHFLDLLNSSDPLVRQLSALEPDQDGDALERTIVSAPGPLARLLHAVICEVRNGAAAEAAFERYGRLARQSWRRELLILAALTSIAPLLGLLGTVAGMVDTFDAVSTAAGATASRVAGGISTALITTQFGLIIALPGVFGLARLERMIRTLEVRWAECRSMVLAIGVRGSETAP